MWPADGTGSVKYQDALAAIFIEGWIFIILSITGARQFLIKLLPRTLALSMSAGKFLAGAGQAAFQWDTDCCHRPPWAPRGAARLMWVECS